MAEVAEAEWGQSGTGAPFGLEVHFRHFGDGLVPVLLLATRGRRNHRFGGLVSRDCKG